MGLAARLGQLRAKGPMLHISGNKNLPITQTFLFLWLTKTSTPSTEAETQKIRLEKPLNINPVSCSSAGTPCPRFPTWPWGEGSVCHWQARKRRDAGYASIHPHPTPLVSWRASRRHPHGQQDLHSCSAGSQPTYCPPRLSFLEKTVS